ncbi:MAG TPA: winged helix-turn-helix domain-containing protein [Candidatus Bathyarchaeia archaeon]|nr:winged helix-turn-helix domain-containing protein [Candidatus Bathyarchaeia archaeon]
MASILLEYAMKDGLRRGLKERFKERRGKLDIMVDILSTAREGVRKTEMVYRANLNFTRAERYIPFLEERGLMEYSGAVYKTTGKGEEFLQEYQMIKELFLT